MELILCFGLMAGKRSTRFASRQSQMLRDAKNTRMMAGKSSLNGSPNSSPDKQ
jgi:hypothetical protein